MDEPKFCPACNADFRGSEIPEKDRHHFGGHTHFSRVIGVSCRDRDRTVGWQCPDCGYSWEEK